ncbi:hypothetical protein B5F77_02075 [Parabacteroides sp. An277]|uniref:DUF554 domain-containing protein n=1 Tax=Parabacteroides sp. An277 TaxID=1965619 RepID=UPI000B3ADDFE|nr:DUF554 domain-containing protein [Parabacteroides sp. An277]OUO55002.1 hypothetical protein B5F77_02075 [Parabacteroides sp. An277]
MIGTIVNTLCIVAGSCIGSVAKRAIKPRYQSALYNALGLATLVLGANAVVTHLPDSSYPVLFIASLALGSLVGTICDLDGRFKRLVKRFSRTNLAEGLSTGILLFCVGSLSMVGPILSALYGDNTYLFTNAMLDLVSSAILASTYGIGMALAAPVLFCSQGTIYLITSLAGNVISEALMNEITIVGGVLIVSSGLAILRIQDCKTVNMLPALLFPILFFGVKQLLSL